MLTPFAVFLLTDLDFLSKRITEQKEYLQSLKDGPCMTQERWNELVPSAVQRLEYFQRLFDNQLTQKVNESKANNSVDNRSRYE